MLRTAVNFFDHGQPYYLDPDSIPHRAPTTASRPNQRQNLHQQYLQSSGVKEEEAE